MTKEKRIVAGLFLVGCVLCVSLAYSQTETRPLHQRPIISVVGRLASEKHGEEEWLVLHAKNADTYLIAGSLIETLKNSLLELGQNNLMFVTGNQDGRSNVSCEQSYQYEYNKEGEKELKIDTKCIRYYNFEVTQILFAKKSDEDIPPPKRDIDEESRLIASRIGQNQSLTPLVTGEIYGKITSVNFKSPIKTIDIANRDKDSPLKKIVLIVGNNTRIAKKISEEEPMGLTEKALAPGQEVTAVYTRDELKSQALFITITKE